VSLSLYKIQFFKQINEYYYSFEITTEKVILSCLLFHFNLPSSALWFISRHQLAMKQELSRIHAE